ncbi:hypothetical protein [Gracilibacillus sp. HCP3S3_G5_2]|uniref:hypothetical protein n=1 Tax=Gracilibacillus sp. HCP3S3_G5_2 TaxID=3438941 RepID=UPI003F8C1845
MVPKERSGKKRFFNVPKEDELHFTLKDKQKAEKEKVVEKVFKELDNKYRNKKNKK